MTLRQRLERVLHHTVTDLVVAALILLSVALMILEVNCRPQEPARRIYELLGMAITVLFIIELSLRWWVARSHRLFWREYWLDVLATLPLIRPLRMLRLLRLFRLVRLGVLVSRRTRKLAAVLHQGISENFLIAVVLFVVLLFGAVGMSVAEPDNPALPDFPSALWWSLYTMMAGEPIGATPVSFGGRVITMAVMLGGFTIFAMFTGIVSAVMVERLRGGMEAKEMELEDLKGHYLICGWNRSGATIVRELQANPETQRLPIVVVAELEGDPELPPEGINQGLIFFVRGDYTSTDVLRRVRVEYARKAILLADKSKPRSDQDRDARTVLAALTIEKLHQGMHTCAELLNRANSKALELAGVDEIVVGDEYMGNLIAHATRTGGLVEVLDELLTSSHGSQFYKIPVPRALVGLTVVEALPRLKQSHDTLLVAVETSPATPANRPPSPTPAGAAPANRKRVCLTNPPPDYRLQATDALVVIGSEPPESSKSGIPCI